LGSKQNRLLADLDARDARDVDDSVLDTATAQDFCALAANEHLVTRRSVR
jgi:hypothetical protein